MGWRSRSHRRGLEEVLPSPIGASDTSASFRRANRTNDPIRQCRLYSGTSGTVCRGAGFGSPLPRVTRHGVLLIGSVRRTFAAMTGRWVAATLALPAVLVGCSGTPPSSGPVEVMATCPVPTDRPVLIAATLSRLTQSPQTVRVPSGPGNDVSILPPVGTAASGWHLEVVSGGEHVCRSPLTVGQGALATLDPTSAGAVALEATNDSGRQAQLTLTVFRLAGQGQYLTPRHIRGVLRLAEPLWRTPCRVRQLHVRRRGCEAGGLHHGDAVVDRQCGVGGPVGGVSDDPRALRRRRGRPGSARSTTRRRPGARASRGRGGGTGLGAFAIGNFEVPDRAVPASSG